MRILAGNHVHETAFTCKLINNKYEHDPRNDTYGCGKLWYRRSIYVVDFIITVNFYLTENRFYVVTINVTVPLGTQTTCGFNFWFGNENHYGDSVTNQSAETGYFWAFIFLKMCNILNIFTNHSHLKPYCVPN